jgi:hypothetical protein
LTSTINTHSFSSRAMGTRRSNVRCIKREPAFFCVYFNAAKDNVC